MVNPALPSRARSPHGLSCDKRQHHLSGGSKPKGAARRCRFLQKNGRLSKSRSCSKPIWLRAQTRFVKKTNKTVWTFTKKPAHLSRGTYVAAARGIDPFHHVEKQLRHHNVTHFRLR